MKTASTNHPMSASGHRPATGSTAVHILSLILFAGFAIPVSIVMIDAFWPAGFVLAIVFAAFWPANQLAQQKTIGTEEIAAVVKDLIPTSAEQRSSGNASFDAYRTDVIERLETEQVNFEAFLGRLRDAKDKTEFDQFMEDRAAPQRIED